MENNIDLLKNNPKFIGALEEKTLHKLPRVQEGEIAYCTDSMKIKIYTKDRGWVNISSSGEGLKLKLYDLNKSIISQISDLTKEEIDKGIGLIDKFAYDTDNCYYMLYGKEISYFTLFTYLNEFFEFRSIGKAVIECLKNVGSLKSISKTEDNTAIEIWVDSNNNSTCLYFFPYDSGVVGIGE